MNFEKPSEENMELFSKDGLPEVAETEAQKKERAMDNASREYGPEWNLLSEEQKLVVALVPMEESPDNDFNYHNFPAPKNYPAEKQVIYKEAVELMDRAKAQRRKEEEASSEKLKKEQRQAEMNAKAEEHTQKRAEKISEKASAAGLTPEEYISKRRQENKETQA